MSLGDSLFSEDVEQDIITFLRDNKRKRVLVFPPVNNYRRYLIHQLVVKRFSELLRTFSIGQGISRRTVVCYSTDVIREPQANAAERKENADFKSSFQGMGIEEQRSPSESPERARQSQRQAKPTPTVEIYRPPPARRAQNENRMLRELPHQKTDHNKADRAISPSSSSSSLSKNIRQKRPDRAVYVPRHRRSLDAEAPSKVIAEFPAQEQSTIITTSCSENCNIKDIKREDWNRQTTDDTSLLSSQKTEPIDDSDIKSVSAVDSSERAEQCSPTSSMEEKHENPVEDTKDNVIQRTVASDVLIISDVANKESKKTKETSETVPVPMTPPEKKPKKFERQKSKPAAPPSPPLKISRDECDWDSLFDENGRCLDPSLIEELTSAVGEVMIEQPKNDYKLYSKQIEVSSDEFAHVVEIYNFPSDFKTSDLAAVFSPFKNGGFELKWVDDTHCLGVFSSPLVAAEVLASEHPFVKTRPLREATALSKTKARRSAEFLQPYRSRPETCAALARRLVTGALGVKLATARQEREHEKNVLREAKEKRRIANKQREDAWEGIIPQK